MVVNSRDSGLTEIGVKQLEMAAEWLGLFLMVGPLPTDEKLINLL